MSPDGRLVALRLLPLLPLGFVLVTPGCGWLVPRFDEGGPPDGGVLPAGLAITCVDGTGSERPIADPPPDLDGAVHATRRLRDVLVVEGERLREVTRVSLTSAAGGPRYDTLDFERFTREGASDVTLRVSLPAGVRAGLYTLTLFAAAHEAAAQVYLLQGEPGPQGPAGTQGAAGVAAPAGLTRVVTLPAGDASCPRGGARLLAGTDRDGDGYLDDDEVESDASACHGDPGLECASGACVLSGDLEVDGDIYARGPGQTSLPLTPQVTSHVVFGVGPSASATFATLPDALAALEDVRVSRTGTVVLRLEAGDHVLTSGVVFRHPDGRRVRILGADESAPESTVLVIAAASAQHGVHVVDTSLGAFNGLTVRNQSPRGGHGIIVDGSRATLGPALVVEGFDVGISAYHGAEVVAQGSPEMRVTVTGHTTAFYAQEASLHAHSALATAPNAVPTTIGFHASLGGRVYANSMIVVGHTYGGLASHQSLMHTPSATVVGPGNVTDTKGFLSQYGSMIDASNSVVTNAMFGYQAIYQSTVVANGHGALTGTARPYCAIGDSTVLAPAGAQTACP